MNSDKLTTVVSYIIYKLSLNYILLIMNPNQMSKKPNHLPIFPQQESEHKRSRSRIELTHLQNPQYAPDRSNYSCATVHKPPEASTHHDPSIYQSKTYQYQFPQGNP